MATSNQQYTSSFSTSWQPPQTRHKTIQDFERSVDPRLKGKTPITQPGHSQDVLSSQDHHETQATVGKEYERFIPNAFPLPTSVPHQPQEEQEPQEEYGLLYVNAKQFHRILKRRVARQRLEQRFGNSSSKGGKPYIHESRHNHAMRRPRGPGGRFLSAEEKRLWEEGKELPVKVAVKTVTVNHKKMRKTKK